MRHKKKLSNRFWRMWSAIAASSLGDGIFSVALPLLALRYTRSALAIAGVVIAGQVPAVVAALPFGTLADRVNRRRMIVAIEGGRCLLLCVFGALILMHRVDLALIYCAAFLLGGLNIGFDVVSGACLPSMVCEDDLVRANAHLLNAELTAENLVGQAIGGLALALARFVPFLIDAMSRVASVLLITGAVPDNEPDDELPSAWKDLIEGLRWFLGNPILRLLTAVIASLAFCQGIVLGILPIYGRQTLHLGSGGYGLLLAVASIGVVLGGASASRIHDRLGPGGTLVFAGSVFGAAYPVLAFTHSPLVAACALFAQESTVIVGSTAARALRQRTVPQHMQGRAASANSVITISCYPLGGLLGGAVAGTVGVRSSLLLAACLLAGLLAATSTRLLKSTKVLRLQGSYSAIQDEAGADGPIDLTGRLAVSDTSPHPAAQIAG